MASLQISAFSCSMLSTLPTHVAVLEARMLNGLSTLSNPKASVSWE